MATVLDILDSLAETPSRNSKLSILKENASNNDLKRAFLYALNPLVNYYVRKAPDHESSTTPNISLERAFESLDMLSRRELTGNAAINHLSTMMFNMTEDDAEVIKRILDGDLRCGVNTSSVNKVWPKLVPTYPVLLAQDNDPKHVSKINWPAIVQLKSDGMRFNAIVKNTHVQYFGRSGKPILIDDSELDAMFVKLGVYYPEGVVFDGELVYVQGGDIAARQTGNGIINKAVKGTISKEECKNIHAKLWDIIPYTAFIKELHEVPYNERLNELLRLLNDNFKIINPRIDVIETHILVKNEEEVGELYLDALSRKEEGVVLKCPKMIWENKRSKKMLKYKAEHQIELKVVGKLEGTGINAGRLGALIAETSDGKVRVNVGYGYSFKQRDEFWVNPPNIITVKYNGRIKAKIKDAVDSLYLPAFIEERLDKNEADPSSKAK